MNSPITSATLSSGARLCATIRFSLPIGVRIMHQCLPYPLSCVRDVQRLQDNSPWKPFAIFILIPLLTISFADWTSSLRIASSSRLISNLRKLETMFKLAPRLIRYAAAGKIPLCCGWEEQRACFFIYAETRDGSLHWRWVELSVFQYL